ncbi:MAG: tyrosine-type recombinase/integrase [Pseudomonadota bacterium]
MRTRTKGIQLIDGERIVNKQHRGERIFKRLGAVSQDEAESWLRDQQATADAARQQQICDGDEKLFAGAAAKYLTECQDKQVRTLETIAYHVSILMPFIGHLPLRQICDEALEPFKATRRNVASPTTVNRSLEVVRTVMNRAARVWRQNGRPWISTTPLIEMLKESPRPPQPLSWAQQARLMQHLPGHLQRMVQFAVNTGARDENVCGLRWDWERQVPEIGRSVFVVPPEHFKSNRHHVLVLNDQAWSVVEESRGMHPEFVFVWRRERIKNFELAPAMEYQPVETMNNTAFQNARRAAGLPGVRVHDLRHTFGQRLRDAGTAPEDRALLLGHAIDGMPQHYAAATIARLVEVANSVAGTRDRMTLLKVISQEHGQTVAQNVAHKEKRVSCVNS